MATCSVGGCERKIVAIGLCKLHYYRKRRSGSVNLLQPTLLCKATAIDLAYCAGFIDADGSILIERSKRREGIRHTPRICAVGIERPPLEFLHSIFGGNICAQRRLNASNRRFEVWQWQVTNQRAIVCARALMPHLRIKSVQAYLLSCFDYEATWTKGGAVPRMPKTEFDRREALVEEMRDWNGKAHLVRQECATRQ